MKALIGYGLSGGLVIVLAAAAVAGLVAPEVRAAVWLAAALAFGIQVAAFAVLVAVRRRGVALLAAWGGGSLLRMAVVLGVGVWSARSGSFPPAPLLLSLAGFLFVLLLLESVFFRVGMRSR